MMRSRCWSTRCKKAELRKRAVSSPPGAADPSADTPGPTIRGHSAGLGFPLQCKSNARSLVHLGRKFLFQPATLQFSAHSQFHFHSRWHRTHSQIAFFFPLVFRMAAIGRTGPFTIDAVSGLLVHVYTENSVTVHIKEHSWKKHKRITPNILTRHR